MPIRFRCAHCDKLLGIARRKAGTIVNCPQCGQPLIVPTPEEEPESDAPSPDESTLQSDLKTDHDSKAGKQTKPKKSAEKLFDDVDIDRLLEESPAINPMPLPAPTKPHQVDRTVPKPILTQSKPTANLQPLPMPVPVSPEIPTPTAAGISIGKLIGLIAVVFVLVIGAFIAGVFVGKGMQ